MKNGSLVLSGYSSKKHLVRRHIEATHLYIERFPSQCMWCEKIFNQLSNVGGLSTKPSYWCVPLWVCFLWRAFKDPSKRHKHMLRIHGCCPGKSKKKFRSEESTQE